VGKWENGLGNGKMGKHNSGSGRTHLNVRLRYIETRKIDVGDRNRNILFNKSKSSCCSALKFSLKI
jgi:ASC-1-like (ASCH) protein